MKSLNLKKVKAIVVSSSIDLLNDPLTQVFGKKTKGRPCIGISVSKRKYMVAFHPHIIYSEDRGEKQGFGKTVAKIEAQLDLVYGYRKSHVSESLAFISMRKLAPMHTPRKSSTLFPLTMMENAHGPPLGERDSETSAYIESAHITRLCELFD